jgi:hypothetical protein
VSRKWLVHAVANCAECSWECQDYLTTQAKASAHAQSTGHFVTMDLGYAVEYGERKVRP